MSEDENLQKDMKKQEEQDASKKALKTGAKAAANAYLGPVGGKAVDLASKTKLGDNILNKGAESINKKAPKIGKIANAANKSGALDAADKAVDATSGGTDSLGKDTLGNGKLNFPSNSLFSSTNDSTAEDNEDSLFDSNFDIFDFDSANTKNKRKKVLFWLMLIMIIFILLVVTVGYIYLPLYTANDYVNGIWDQITGLFTTHKDLEKEYYEDLKQAQTDIHNKYGICIDTNLITAALTINKSFDESLDESKDEVEDEIDGEETETVSYKQMKKQINLLANMQIKNNKYSYDKEYKATNGDYCKDNQETVLVTNENQTSFERGFFSWLTTDSNLDSSTPELIASHDVANVAKFFTKKS